MVVKSPRVHEPSATRPLWTFVIAALAVTLISMPSTAAAWTPTLLAPALPVETVETLPVEAGLLDSATSCRDGVWYPPGPCCPQGSLGCCHHAEGDQVCAPKPRQIEGGVSIHFQYVDASALTDVNSLIAPYSVIYWGDFNEDRCDAFRTHDSPTDPLEGADVTLKMLASQVKVKCVFDHNDGLGGPLGVQYYPVCDAASVQARMMGLPLANLAASVDCQGYKVSDYGVNFLQGETRPEEDWTPSGFAAECRASGTPPLLVSSAQSDSFDATMGAPACVAAATGVAAMEVTVHCMGEGRQNVDWWVTCELPAAEDVGLQLI